MSAEKIDVQALWIAAEYEVAQSGPHECPYANPDVVMYRWAQRLERQRDELADALRELASYFYTGNNVRVTRVTFLRRAPEIQRMLSLLARIDAEGKS